MEITSQGVSRRVLLLLAMFVTLPTLSARASVLLDDFSVAFFDTLPNAQYVADVGFDIDPRTPFDDEWVFGRGDAIISPDPWVFSVVAPASFSAFSNADDANFDAVVAHLTNGVDEVLNVDFWSASVVFGSEFRVDLRRPESEWFDVAALAGATIHEIRFDWSPSGLLPDNFPWGASFSGQLGTATISLYAIPEPSTGALLGMGLLVLITGFRARRNSGAGVRPP